MTDSVELREVERLIQVVEDNLRQLQEEATAVSGAADEELRLPAQSLPVSRANIGLASGAAAQ